MQNVFIINFNSLYEILDEIKENLSFKIKKIENEKDFEKKLDLERLDHLVISKIDHKLLLNSNITDKSIQSHYFIKFTNNNDLNDIIQKIKNIKFDSNNTVGPRSISKQELISKINHLF